MADHLARDGVAGARNDVAPERRSPRTSAKSGPTTHKKTSRHTRVKIHPLQSEAGESVVSAIDPIRVEMLSTEMPVHQLAKRGGDEIRIIRRGPNGGQVNLYWKVEPNMGSGRPGQLAYH